MAEQEELTKNISQTQARLQRASKLTTGLADEQIRWSESVKVSTVHATFSISLYSLCC